MADETQMEPIGIALIVLVLLLIFHKQLIGVFRKKKPINKAIPDIMPPMAPRLDWDMILNKEGGIRAQDPTDSIQATLEQLDKDLENNMQNLNQVLNSVVEMQTGVYDKMKVYYQISKDLDDKENILRVNLSALKAVQPQVTEEIKGDVPAEGQCNKCGQHSSFLINDGEFICQNCGEIQ